MHEKQAGNWIGLIGKWDHVMLVGENWMGLLVGLNLVDWIDMVVCFDFYLP